MLKKGFKELFVSYDKKNLTLVLLFFLNLLYDVASGSKITLAFKSINH